MASLRLTFPEKDQPTVIALTGARLTIGRLPFNTIQIIDRTVSGFHAELIGEHGHYRLHDRGSSNGTFVNGQKVSDYHLNEACTIAFGTVEAQFQPEEVATNEEAETFPSRGEVNAVRQENVEMRATVAALREEIEALRQAPKVAPDEAGAAVSREEYERVVVERESLKETQVRQEEELNRLKTDLAILKRDRVNLQLAYDGAQRELEQLRQKVSGADEAPPLAPIEAAAVVAAQADSDTVRIELPPAAAPIVLRSVPDAEPPVVAEPFEPDASEAPQPLAPAASLPVEPAAPAPKPFPKAPAPPSAPGVPGQPAKPAAPFNMPFKPVPKQPSAPGLSKPPGGLGSAIRAVARPPIAPSGATDEKSDSPAHVPTTRLTQRPLATKLPGQPTVKLTATPPPQSGPKGTQKLAD